MSLFHTEESKKVFEDPRLPEPKSVWNYFLALIEVPRGSGHSDLIIPKLLEWGKGLGLETFTDEARNVVIKKPASPGYEKYPVVALQAHYDMVAVKRDEVVHDFKTDPLKPQINPSPNEKYGKYVLRATGTSLGADDGIGVAIILSIFADKTLKHGPLEALFTRDEETTMEGSLGVKPGLLKAKYLINVDSEESWRICIGCAGGFITDFTLPLTKSNVNGILNTITIGGLRGGHSGVEIHEGRANALKLLQQVIQEAAVAVQAQDNLALQTFLGGDKRNVIPHNATASVVIPTNKNTAFLGAFANVVVKLKKEWKTVEPDLNISIKSDDSPASHAVYDTASSVKFLDTVNVVPHGIIRFSPDVVGLVETSINLSKVSLNAGAGDIVAPLAVFEFLGRSSDDDQLPTLYDKLGAIARLVSGTILPYHKITDGWLPDTSTHLLAVSKQAYKDIVGVDAEIYAVHAGLECGILQKSHPTLKCISVGPYLTNVHSPDETVYVDTVGLTYSLILKTLANLDN